MMVDIEAKLYNTITTSMMYYTTEEQATKARVHVGVVGALSCVKPPPKNTLPGEIRVVK